MADGTAVETSAPKPEPVTAPAEATEAGQNASEGAAQSALLHDDERLSRDMDAPKEAESSGPAKGADGDLDGLPKRTKSNAKKSDKRGSTGIPEHKSKKLNRKKSMPALHTNVSEGEHWYATMKGFPPWPCVILSEKMLPLSLLQKRPVSARRTDGSWREDFDDGGKNVKDRRFPVMFLGTYEFSWQHNTDLSPLDLEDVKDIVDRNDKGKKSVALWEAYKEAAQNHDLEYYDGVLQEMEQEENNRQAELQKKEAEKEAEAQRKLEKKAKAKVKKEAAVDEGSDSGEKKSAKKRKKHTESDDEGDAPAKTSKIKISLKVQDEPTPKQKKPRKSKAAAESEEESKPTPQAEEPPLTEAERLDRKQKTILYLRHKLQKGLLARDNPPKAEEMNNMAEHFTVLEQHTNLEPDIIRSTKINKVLKVILKLSSIPREEEFRFKKRAEDLLGIWQKTLSASDSKGEGKSAPNGVNHSKEGAGKEEEKGSTDKGTIDGDAEMKDAPDVPDAPDDRPTEMSTAGAEASAV